MSKTVFLDCDDTLILWQHKLDTREVLYTYNGEAYRVNILIINTVKKLVERGFHLVVWSFGGIDYATHWAELFLPKYLEWTVEEKLYTRPQAGDIVIDDWPSDRTAFRKKSKASVVSELYSVKT